MKRVCRFVFGATLFAVALGYSMPLVTSVPQPAPDPWNVASVPQPAPDPWNVVSVPQPPPDPWN